MIRSLAPLLLAFSGVFFAAPAASQTAPAAPAAWVEVAPPEGMFRVQMPAKPERRDGDITAEQGGPGRTVMYTSVVRPSLFLAGWGEYAPSFKFDDQTELAANRDNFVTAVGARLVATRAITLNGAPGIEFDLAMDGEFVGRARVYIIAGKPFQLSVLTGGATLDAAGATRFFESFRAVPAR